LFTESSTGVFVVPKTKGNKHQTEQERISENEKQILLEFFILLTNNNLFHKEVKTKLLEGTMNYFFHAENNNKD
jgi:hypothetical protein